MPRSYIYDAIALIWSYLAQCSHIKEHLVKLRQDRQITKDKKLLSNIDKEIEQLELLYSMVISQRRSIMSNLEKSVDLEPTMHCMFKHAIESFNYAAEVEDATTELWDLTTPATDILNLVLSLATWNDIEFCSRCLWDLLISNKQ